MSSLNPPHVSLLSLVPHVNLGLGPLSPREGTTSGTRTPGARPLVPLGLICHVGPMYRRDWERRVFHSRVLLLTVPETVYDHVSV